MSKSKGNVIDPLEPDRRVRRRRAALHPRGAWRRRAATSSCRRSRVEGYRNFATKLWNAARFAEHYDCGRSTGFDPATAKATLNRWIATETARAARAVTAAIEAYKFNEAAAAALSLRLEPDLRLVPGTRQAGARRRGRRRPRTRRGRRSPGSSTRSSACCIRSCRSSPRSSGPRRPATARRSARCWRSANGRHRLRGRRRRPTKSTG